MLKIFNCLINSFIENKVGIADDFINASLSIQLKDNLNDLFSNDQLNAAGTGNVEVDHNKLFRSDLIYWLDRKHENVYENNFLDLIDSFIKHLNETCYTGITGYEFHYTLYEKNSYYNRHIDQFQNSDSRKYSMIIYLNENWQEKDGGELRIYHANTAQDVSPTSGKTVFFKSKELAHEVLITHKNRMRITGWLKA